MKIIGSVNIFEYCHLSIFGKVSTVDPFFATSGEILRKLECSIFQLNGITRNNPHNLRSAIRFLSCLSRRRCERL